MADDNHSWGDWLDAHGARLLLFARQQARSDAEDVLQEALVRLWKRLGEAPPIAFAFREIRRVAIDRARSEIRRERREEASQNDAWFEPSMAVGDAETALTMLKPPQAEAIILKLWGGLTFKEIAKVLGIPQDTAASRYRNGIARLREQLDPEISNPANN